MKDFEIRNFTDLEEAHAFFNGQETTDVWQKMYTNEIEAVPLENNPLNLHLKGAFKMTCADGAQIEGFEKDVTEDDILSSMESTKTAVAISNGTKKVLYPLRYTAFGHLQDRAGITGRSINSLKDKARANEMAPATRCECLNNGLRLYRDSTLALIRDGKVTALLSGDVSDYSIMPVTRLMKILENELNGEFGGVSFAGGSVTHEIVDLRYEITDSNYVEMVKNLLESYGMLVENLKLTVRLTTSDVGLCAARLTPLMSFDGSPLITFGKSLSVEHKGGDKAMTLFVDVADRFLASFRDNTDNIVRLMNVKIKEPSRCLQNVYDALKLRGYSYELKEAKERIMAEHQNGCSAFDIYWYLNEMLLSYQENRKNKNLSISPLDSIKAQETVAQVLFMDLAAFDE